MRKPIAKEAEAGKGTREESEQPSNNYGKEARSIAWKRGGCTKEEWLRTLGQWL